jgi:HAD superfamily hydrolase (TIGR01484 family)
MVITDLDGTLLPSTGMFSPTDIATLHDLGQRGIPRIIATGRSLYSARHVLPHNFPIDYLVFSSGAGIMEWRSHDLLMTHQLHAPEIRLATDLLHAYDLDFMIHDPIPDNHHFWYHTTGQENPDFVRRWQRYQEFATPLNSKVSYLEAACQIVAIDPLPGRSSKYERIKQQLSALKVIRSTSPLDGKSTWIEIFPLTVSKALASSWIAEQDNIPPDGILAIGNDYNDLDLLEWAGQSYVVKNAPDDLRQRYRTVRSSREAGFSEAVQNWLSHAKQ